MSLPAPRLDNRRFDDIVAEALALVPRYTPEWTDLNAGDPGRTIVELYAWLTEMVLFRLNQVPDLLYVKFLELLGIQLRPAEPATVELTFSLVDPAPSAVIVIPRGTRAAAASGQGGEPVVFETDRALNALGLKLAAILSFDGFAFNDATAASAAGRPFPPLGAAPRTDSALYLGFDYGGAFPDATEVDLLALMATAAPPVQGVQCRIDQAVPPPARLVWEGWDGNSWVRVTLNRDDTRAFTRTGHISLLIPPGLHLVKLRLPGRSDLLYWVRGRVVQAGYDVAPLLTGVVTNSVPATQAITVEDEVLGGSDGSPSQVFRLFFSPVVAGTLELEIDEGQGFQRWREVEDFFAFGPDDLVYTHDRAQGMITLPDGRHGHLPVANPGNPNASVVARRYRTGGGLDGNQQAGAITQLQTSPVGVSAVTNLRPAEGGADEETLDDARARAAEELKSRDRAVTAEDFSYLARITPGVRIRRAQVLPMVHPAFPDVPIPGCITVIVVPDTADPAPTPSEATLRAVCAQLDAHRLLTTEIHVIAPTYRTVRVQAQVRARPTADLAVVRQAVDGALTRYFHPLQGGDDGAGWPLGGTTFYSLVVRTVIEADPGVARIDSLTIRLDGQELPFCQDGPIRPRDLLTSSGHDITVLYT
jgi:predicted phage baseplate assembly protein